MTENTCDDKFDFANLPLDIITKIFSYLNVSDQFSAFWLVSCLGSKQYQLRKEINATPQPPATFFKQLATSALPTSTAFHRLFTQYKKIIEKIEIFAGGQTTVCISGSDCYTWGVRDYIVDQKNYVNAPQLVALQDQKIVAAALYSDVMYLTLKGLVFAYGYNTDGELGLGINGRVHTPTLLTSLSDKKVVAIAAGWSHTVFLTAEAKVYSCGNNYDGQLGIGNNNNNNSPQLITALSDQKIISVAAGRCHTVFLTEEGKVYICGLNCSGQLGLGNKNTQNTPQFITSLAHEKIIAIAAVGMFTLFLTAEGKVYGCGSNYSGQLGLGNLQPQNKPELITALKDHKIIKIASGNCFSLFLSDTGKVFGCGLNDNGQLGLGHYSDQKTPQFIKELDQHKIVDIAAGQQHSVFTTLSGKIFSCGSNVKGQLGLGHETKQNTPQEIKLIKPILTSAPTKLSRQF